MNRRVYRLKNPEEYRRAGGKELIELDPPPGRHPLFIRKTQLEVLTLGIVGGEFIHISGPTGTGKSTVLDYLQTAPANFERLCRALELPLLPLQIYPIEMVWYETPGELYFRRAISSGNTFDEPSALVVALRDAASRVGQGYPLIWLREFGRVQSAAVQGGLLNLMTRGEILLPGGVISGNGIAWVADSNYQAALDSDSTHTLVALDDALRRRLSLNLTLGYLTPEEEAEVLLRIAREWKPGAPVQSDDQFAVGKVVQLGQAIRRRRADGELLSVPPPSISGYLGALRLSVRLPSLPLQDVVQLTMLGNAGADDLKALPGVLSEVFGLQAGDSDELGLNAF